jgi:hypothetical protein
MQVWACARGAGISDKTDNLIAINSLPRADFGWAIEMSKIMDETVVVFHPDIKTTATTLTGSIKPPALVIPPL